MPIGFCFESLVVKMNGVLPTMHALMSATTRKELFQTAGNGSILKGRGENNKKTLILIEVREEELSRIPTTFSTNNIVIHQ